MRRDAMDSAMRVPIEVTVDFRRSHLCSRFAFSLVFHHQVRTVDFLKLVPPHIVLRAFLRQLVSFVSRIIPSFLGPIIDSASSVLGPHLLTRRAFRLLVSHSHFLSSPTLPSITSLRSLMDEHTLPTDHSKRKATPLFFASDDEDDELAIEQSLSGGPSRRVAKRPRFIDDNQDHSDFASTLR